MYRLQIFRHSTFKLAIPNYIRFASSGSNGGNTPTTLNPATSDNSNVTEQNASSASNVPAAFPDYGRSDVAKLDRISGTPEYIHHCRYVKIYMPCKNAMQSGTNATHYWKLDFDVEAKWENHMMGWTSSADPLQALEMKFSSREAAINFAEKQGYKYWVEEPNIPNIKPKTYADNFKYSPGKLRLIKTK